VVAALPGYLIAAFTIDKIGRKLLQSIGFGVMALAFLGLWLIPGATTTVLPFLLLFGATYFFAEFGPNTTTFVYPSEIFPVRVRTTSYGIAAASGKSALSSAPTLWSRCQRSASARPARSSLAWPSLACWSLSPCCRSPRAPASRTSPSIARPAARPRWAWR
jgi:MFS family permease